VTTIADKIHSGGVVGAGGAGFPTHIKAESRVDVVIANGAECEPLLGNDKILMKTHTEEILKGLSLMAEATGAKRGIIAVKEIYTDVLRQIKKYAGMKKIETFPLKNYYPAGDEHEIVSYVTGRLIPEMGIPLHVGAVTNNVETLLNVALANRGIPVTHRYISVIGEIHAPAVYHTPIGTSINTLLESAGGVTCADPVYILGGVMMGRLTEDPAEPLTKLTGAIFVLNKDFPLIADYLQSYTYSLLKAKSACTQCRLCTDACSRFLLGHRLYPHRIMLLPDLEIEGDSPLARSAFLCSDCGCCEYACPMGLSPRKVIRVLKKNLTSRNISYDPRDYSPQLQPSREDRHIPMSRLLSRYGLQKYNSGALHLSKKVIKPEKVILPLKQHIGLNARPVKKTGTVEKGELIARVPRNKVGANLHAPISGHIVEVTAETMTIAA
jgi:Na+-translocating ferredoxin:NAD+ oxidoreductase RnfC subunit